MDISSQTLPTIMPEFDDRQAGLSPRSLRTEVDMPDPEMDAILALAASPPRISSPIIFATPTAPREFGSPYERKEFFSKEKSPPGTSLKSLDPPPLLRQTCKRLFMPPGTPDFSEFAPESENSSKLSPLFSPVPLSPKSRDF